MKIKFTLVSVFFLSSIMVVLSRGGDLGAGENGSTGGMGIMLMRSTFTSNPSIEVHILDSNTGVEIDAVPLDELDNVTKNLTVGEYLLIYSEANGSVIQEVFFLKE